MVYGLGAMAAPAPVELARFTGLSSCQSSSCHGGGTGMDQCAKWATVDFHVRAFAILLTPRSKVITDAMGEAGPSVNERCTVCHGPLATISPARLMPGAHGDQGVSCEICHYPASNWLRSHTRLDYTYAQKLASGMNDLRSPYARANTCVACHEYLSPDIAKAGHPELIFELDSQTVSEPPHWKDTDPWIGLHSWLAGQAVAFREDTWHMLKSEPGSASRWDALGWLIGQTTAEIKGLPRCSPPDGPMSAGQLAGMEKSSDQLGRTAAQFPWTKASAQDLLRRLAACGDDIRSVKDSDRQMHRSEVLVQGLDRLLVELGHQGVQLPAASKRLDVLFADVRTPDAYDVATFCRDLEQFSKALSQS